MRPPRLRRGCATALLVIGAALAGVSLAGCGSDDRTVAAPLARPAAAPSSRRALASMPVSITLEPPASMGLLDLKPGLATWRAGIVAEDAIRIMTPRTVGAPRGGEQDAPADLHRYLVGQEPRGVRITDDRTVASGGLEGHLFTVTTSRVVPSGLGCWADLPDTCFDIPLGLRLRVATFTVHRRPVILWARTSRAHPSAELVRTFERMLSTVRFDG